MHRFMLYATLLLLIPAAAHAQGGVSIHLGGGLGLPGDGLEDTNTGPAVIGGLSVSVTEHLAVIAEGQYSQYGADEDEVDPALDATAKMTGGNLGVLLQTPLGNKMRPYVHLGFGITRGTATASASFLGEKLNISDSENSLSFLVGVGMKYAVSESVSLMVDTRVNHALEHFEGSRQWIPLTVGIALTFPQ